MRASNVDKNEPDAEISDQDIIERQAVKFAQEFSGLYKSEKKKREELEVLSNELKERNEELMDIVFLTSNQLLEPINKIEANITLIKEHIDSPQGGLLGWFDETEKSVERLHQVVNQMSKLYRIKSLRSLFRPVSLDNLLAEVLEDLKTTLERKRATVAVEALPVLETDSVQVRILFNQLIMLGACHQRGGEPADLSIRAGRNARGFWRITLASQGMGFLGHNFAFEKYDRRNGMNRSLDLCQRISQRLGGFLYGERISEKAFSCHVVLPEKNIPPASYLKSPVRDF